MALTVVLGGFTYLTEDARFLLVKPSIVYACIGAAMLQKGWLGRYFPQIVRETLPPAEINRAGWLWAGLMFVTAALNLALVAALPPREAAGVLAVWATASKIALFLAQYASVRLKVRRVRLARQAAGSAPARAP